MYCLLVFGINATCAQNQEARLVIPSGHTSGITAVDISPNGRFLLTGSLDNSVKIWNRTGAEIRTLSAHKRNVLAVAFSPKCPDDPEGGSYVLSGSSDHTAILWDALGNKKGVIKNHSGYVTSVAFSPDGKNLLTGSKDGTAMLFDGACEFIRKFPHGVEITTVSFSPKGKLILTAGIKGSIALWESSGKIRKRFSTTDADVLCAVFSPDGDTILTGAADGTATLWKSTGEKIRVFQHANPVTSVGFLYTKEGLNVVTAINNGSILIWGLAEEKTPAIKLFDRNATTLKIAPNGTYILTGNQVNTYAVISDIKGKRMGLLQGYTSAITALNLSPDGSALLVGNADSLAKVWELDGMGLKNFKLPAKPNTLSFSPRTPEDSLGAKFILIACEDDTSRIQDQTGKLVHAFHTAGRAVFTPDGKSVLTGNGIGKARLWDLNTGTSRAISYTGGRVTAIAVSPVQTNMLFALGSYNGGVFVWDSVNAIPRTFDLTTPNNPFPTESIRSLAFSPDGKSLLIGGEGGLTQIRSIDGSLLYDYPNQFRGIQNVSSVAFSSGDSDDSNLSQSAFRANGSTGERWNYTSARDDVKAFLGHSAEITAVCYSNNGKYVFTASKDGTIIIWDVATNTILGRMIALDSTDWAVTTPRGLFDASPGAMKLMHFTTGMEVVELDQLKDRYYEPGVLQKILGFSEGELRDVSAMASVALFPEINAIEKNDSLFVSLTNRAGGMGKLSFYINGKEVSEDINIGRTNKISINLNLYGQYYLPGVNILALRSFNKAEWLKSQPYELLYFPQPTVSGRGGPDSNSDNSDNRPLERGKPHLYTIVVGTADYSGTELDLRFPDLDAIAMDSALKIVGKALFEDRFHSKLLTSDAKIAANISTKATIEAAFKEFTAQATAIDVLVVYFSGHGLTYGSAEKSQFYYLTKDIASTDLSDDVKRENFTVSSEDLTSWFNAMPAKKQVMILDACNSGKVVEAFSNVGARALNPSQVKAFDRMKDRTGMFILTGAAADKVSFEASQYGQGLLTYSLLQGMSGIAPFEEDMVDVMTLFQHARNVVPELAKGIRKVQIPILSFPNGGNTFAIGLVEPGAKIPLAQIKPVFIRNDFQDQDKIRDVLGLNAALAENFKAITARGAQASIIYADVNEYINAYSIKGRYKISDKNVEVDGHLFQGEQEKGCFTVTGDIDNVPKLVKEILQKAMGLIQ